MRDDELVERVRRGFEPPAMDDAEVRRFDAALESRLGERRRPTWALAPAAALTVVLLVWWWPVSEAPVSPEPAPVVALEAEVLDTLVAAGESGNEWADEDAPDPWLEAPEDEAFSLPGEYLALAEILNQDEGLDPLEVFR